MKIGFFLEKLCGLQNMLKSVRAAQRAGIEDYLLPRQAQGFLKLRVCGARLMAFGVDTIGQEQKALGREIFDVQKRVTHSLGHSVDEQGSAITPALPSVTKEMI